MQNKQNTDEQYPWEEQHRQAFNVACVLPVNLAEEIHQEVALLLDKGAAFDTLKTALQRLTKRTLATLPVSS